MKAPLVTDRASYDTRSMTAARLARYADRLAETVAAEADIEAAERSLVRRLEIGRKMQRDLWRRPIPRHRALVIV